MTDLRPPCDAAVAIANLSLAGRPVCADERGRVHGLHGRRPVQKCPCILRRLVRLPRLVAELKVAHLRNTNLKYFNFWGCILIGTWRSRF